MRRPRASLIDLLMDVEEEIEKDGKDVVLTTT